MTTTTPEAYHESLRTEAGAVVATWAAAHPDVRAGSDAFGDGTIPLVDAVAARVPEAHLRWLAVTRYWAGEEIMWHNRGSLRASVLGMLEEELYTQALEARGARTEGAS